MSMRRLGRRRRRMRREHFVQRRSGDLTLLIAISRRESTQQDGESPLRRRQVGEIELRRKTERIVVQRDRPRRRARVRGRCETHQLLEYLAVRNAERVDVEWLVAHGTDLCVGRDRCRRRRRERSYRGRADLPESRIGRLLWCSIDARECYPIVSGSINDVALTPSASAWKFSTTR
jgi:hypothetical protein